MYLSESGAFECSLVAVSQLYDNERARSLAAVRPRRELTERGRLRGNMVRAALFVYVYDFERAESS